MRTLLSPRSGITTPTPPPSVVEKTSPSFFHQSHCPTLSFNYNPNIASRLSSLSLSSIETLRPLSLLPPTSSFSTYVSLTNRKRTLASAPILAASASPNDESEKAILFQAPPHADVVKSLKNGIILNLLGMAAAILGMQATVGRLVSKALTTSAAPYHQSIAPGSSRVLAVDIFLVQASASTILSHFLGLVISLELLRSVTLPLSESIPAPRVT